MKLNIVDINGGVCVIPSNRPQNPAHALIVAATSVEAERKVREIRQRQADR